MFLILAGSAGFLAALLIHWISRYTRRNHLSFTVVAGVLSALGLTAFCLLFLNSDIANMMLVVLMIFWAVALGIGYLQARSLAIPWWKGTLSIFFEMALAFLTGAAVNLGLQSYIPWFGEHFPEVDVYAVINTYLWTMIIILLILAVVRPLFLLNNRGAVR